MPLSENGKKILPVGTLMKILAVLEPTDIVLPNKVGNLTVHRGSDPETSYIGYIDFADGAVVLFGGGANAFNASLDKIP